jgi:hemolysin activation/secretion protein
VSGRPAGSLPVDQGAAWRAELSWSLPAVLGQGALATMAAPYLFHAEGRGRLLQPTAVEQARVSASSHGLGLRASTLGLTGTQAQIAAELARCWGAPGDERRWRLGLRLSVFM